MPWDDDMKSYLRTKVLIMDPPRSVDSPGGDVWSDKHEWNCRQMRKLFLEYSDADVVWMYMQKGSGKKDLLRRIDEELAGMTEDDLVIVWYEGDAYGENDKYYWKFRGDPDRIKGYQVIEKFYTTRADCLLFLDCHTHDRLEKKQKRGDGNTETVTTGTQHKESNGKSGYSLGHDFTDGFLSGLRNYVDRLIEEREKEERAEESGRPRKKKKYELRTVPEILKDIKAMFSNANRPDRKRTRAGGEDVIMRFKVDPNLIKQTGKLEFFAKLLQGEPAQRSEETAVDEMENRAVEEAQQKAAAEVTAVEDGAAMGTKGLEDEGVGDMGSVIGNNAPLFMPQ